MNKPKIRLRFMGSCLKQEKVTFNPRDAVNLFIVYELYRLLQNLNDDFTLKDCLFRAVKLTRNADPDKYSYSDMVLDLILVHVFHVQVLNGVKMLLFLK